MAAVGFYESRSGAGSRGDSRSEIVEARRRRRMGARKHRRYLNSILANVAVDHLEELSQSEIEFQEEEFPDFNDRKSYFSSADSQFRKGEEGGSALLENDSNNRKEHKISECETLRKRLTKNTRKLILRSCNDSKFFRELEDTLICFKLHSTLVDPTTFELASFSAEDNKIVIDEFDSFQRFLVHRICKFHDLTSKSSTSKDCSGKFVEITRPASDRVGTHHKRKIFDVICS
mmetsp:Transcript_25032/g.44512  ORF Transcript_25032/g.44512 Transcript_25032/m.44512 type:complete len:232 (-) Transcript_25032:274-969(-)|eukprot:CAMPEP_0197520174 /NCGR_PEP_ID=MMETSP1318-20131121/5484_1 /TAXON_ID=552666 /ORGANISM="Partenskyella glossopodia, Strain RCC365" /LENGTH=231 /DNA_ID=CAMNT_0043071587 /DNA_START=156 /DNA_END=851 /DNA_ORIENTATION=+